MESLWFINVKKICKKIFLDLFGRLPFYIVEMCSYVNSPWWQKHMVLMREQYTYIPMIYQTSLEVWLFEIQMLMSAGIFSAKELKQESKIKIFFFSVLSIYLSLSNISVSFVHFILLSCYSIFSSTETAIEYIVLFSFIFHLKLTFLQGSRECSFHLLLKSLCIFAALDG